jgi:uncharacterized protein (DUF433 family)
MATLIPRLEADPLPLSQDPAGVIRIAGTRVSLESIVVLYDDGASVPELAQAFPDLSLPDIHAAIAYLLRHREEVEAYLEERRRQARAAEERLRAEFPEVYQEVRLDEAGGGENTPSR